MRDFTRLRVIVLFCGILVGQSSEASRFEISDIHTSAKTNSGAMRVSPARNGRYEIRNATMLILMAPPSVSRPTKYWVGRTGWNSTAMT